MKLFFILGSNPALSVAELASLFLPAGADRHDLLSAEVFLLDIGGEIDGRGLIKNLGGTIKIGRIIDKADPRDNDGIFKAVLRLAPDKFDGKYKFGFSNYSQLPVDLKFLGMKLKRSLSDMGLSARWVTSREKVLSSVVVEQNKMVSKGMEIVFLPGQNGILVGQTLAVQPFKELSFRDYGRPARDDYSGLLPPKLAQMMINLAGATGFDKQANGGWSLPDPNAVILDPFCGSGTIITEAMLMGFVNLIGADISAKAVEDTKKNAEWTRKNYECRMPHLRQGFGGQMNIELFNKSALDLSKFMAANSAEAIVTEPYLGPQRGKVDYVKEKKELADLYAKSLLEFYKVLKPGGRAVMVWPVFLRRQTADGRRQVVDYSRLDVNINFFRIINPVPEKLRASKFIRLTDRNTIIYGRPGQKVWREIVVMEKPKAKKH